ERFVARLHHTDGPVGLGCRDLSLGFRTLPPASSRGAFFRDAARGVVRASRSPVAFRGTGTVGCLHSALITAPGRDPAMGSRPIVLSSAPAPSTTFPPGAIS